MGVRHRHTPTTNVLGQSSKICRFSVPFHLIWLNMSHNWASAEQTMTSMLVQPELSHFTGRQRNLSCSAYSSNSVSCILFVFLFFFFLHAWGDCPFALPVSPLSLSSSHSRANFISPMFGCELRLSHRMWSLPACRKRVLSVSFTQARRYQEKLKRVPLTSSHRCCIHRNEGE